MGAFIEPRLQGCDEGFVGQVGGLAFAARSPSPQHEGIGAHMFDHFFTRASAVLLWVG